MGPGCDAGYPTHRGSGYASRPAKLFSLASPTQGGEGDALAKTCPPHPIALSAASIPTIRRISAAVTPASRSDRRLVSRSDLDSFRPPASVISPW